MSNRHHEHADKLVAEFKEIMVKQVVPNYQMHIFRTLYCWCVMQLLMNYLLLQNAWKTLSGRLEVRQICMK